MIGKISFTLKRFKRVHLGVLLFYSVMMFRLTVFLLRLERVLIIVLCLFKCNKSVNKSNQLQFRSPLVGSYIFRVK